LPPLPPSSLRHWLDLHGNFTSTVIGVFILPLEIKLCG